MAPAKHNWGSLLFPLTDHTTLLILKTQLEAQLDARVPQASKEWTAGWVLIPHDQHSIAVPPSAC